MNHFFIVWGAVALGGLIGYLCRIPSGVMVGGMIVGLAVKIAFAPDMESSRWLSTTIVDPEKWTTE